MFDTLIQIPISTSANHIDGSFVIKDENTGINNKIEEESLKGRFRLMNGNIYRVVDDEPPSSDLLKLSAQTNLKDDRVNS